MTFTPPRVVLWDLDGTLLDSIPDLEGAIRAARRAEGLPELPPDHVRRSVGDGARKLVERCFPASPPSDLDRLLGCFLEAYRARPTTASRPFPGIPALVRRLRGDGRLQAVVTNKPHDLAERVVRELFPGPSLRFVRGARSGVRLKPSPDLLLEILDEVGFPPDSAWMVGDHVTDLRAGRAAGCTTVFCRWGYGRRDGVVPDLEAATAGDLARLLGVSPQEVPERTGC